MTAGDWATGEEDDEDEEEVGDGEDMIGKEKKKFIWRTLK